MKQRKGPTPCSTHASALKSNLDHASFGHDLLSTRTPLSSSPRSTSAFSFSRPRRSRSPTRRCLRTVPMDPTTHDYTDAGGGSGAGGGVGGAAASAASGAASGAKSGPSADKILKEVMHKLTQIVVRARIPAHADVSQHNNTVAALAC